MQKAIIFDFNRTLYDPDTQQLMPDVLNVLRYLKQLGYKMFLIGKGTEERKTLIQDIGVAPFFDKIIVKDEKDFNDFLNLKNEYPEHEFYSVGDRVKKEIKYSNQVGCKTIWLKRGKFAIEEPIEPDETPWKIINELHEIKTTLPI
jgi:FMN phosphatase YigB (HAD superfamily)